jgi:Mg-chelatase subunit ChlD
MSIQHPRVKRKGQTIIMVALALSFLVSLGGLSVDLVFAYAVKHFLGIAIDSVALSAMRGLASGASYEEQAASIQRISNLMLSANFPSGFLLSTDVGFTSPPSVHGPNIPSDAPATFVHDSTLEPGTREVRVAGAAVVPTFFARAFGVQSLTVRSSATAARQDTNVVLVIDRSGSLAQAGAWEAVQDAATTFLDFFDNNGDRLGLVSFASAANVDMSLRSGFKDGSFAANQISKMESAGGTNAAGGLWLAYAELLRINDPASLNVIVFFTDGQPTGFPNTWTVHTHGSPRGGNSNNPTCDVAQKTAVIQTFTNATEMLGFNRMIAGPPPVKAASGWTADFNIVDGCTRLTTPLAQNVELLLDNTTCLPTQWAAIYDSSTGCESCTAGESYSQTFDIVPGPYGGYPPCNSTMFSTATGSSATFRGNRWMESSRNLAVDIATKASADPTVGNIHVYALGLGVADVTENEDFLLRVANDKRSPTFDTSRPEGEYVFAPTAADLSKAFDKVRGNVIRLTR